MPSLLLIGGAGAGATVDVAVVHPTYDYPKGDGTVERYVLSTISDLSSTLHQVYVLEGADAIILLLAAYMNHG